LPFTPVIDFSRAGVVQSLAESRQRLGLERIDIALVHDPDDYLEDALAESYPALAELRAAGVLGAIGAGMNWSEPLTRLAESADFDCFLLAGRYTLLEQGPLDNLFPVAEEKSMAIIAGGVYNSGLLIDPRPGATYDYAPADDAVIARARRIRDVCARYDVPIGAAAVQFPLAHPVVATVLVGARSAGEVDRSVELMTWEIPGELWLSLKEDELLREDAPTP
jgi:D-threo-aldose 1-dehydrogenase